MTDQNTNLIPPPKNKTQFVKLLKKGQSLYKNQDYTEALRYLTSAWQYDDSDHNLLTIVADCLFKKGNQTAALNLMAHALKRSPKDANICSVLGNAALKMEFFDLAAKFHQKYIELRPNEAIGYSNYASALREDGKIDEAIAYLQDIIPIFPDNDLLWNTLASTVAFRDGPGEAIVFYEQCLQLNPQNVQALNNIAPAYVSVGRIEDAENAANEAIRLSPNLKDPKLFLSGLKLKAKKLKEGWEYYQLRPGPKEIKATLQHNKVPYWHGEDLTGKKILVYGEQGIGDEILFTWLYDELANVAEEVAFSCEERLVDLFQSSFPYAKVGATYYVVNTELDYRIFMTHGLNISDYDYQCLAGDLPLHFWDDYDKIQPNSEPILKPNKQEIKKWKKRLETLPQKISVGISWRSGNRKAKRSRNYAGLQEWEPIMRDKKINFINIQYGDCAEELAEFKAKTGITIHNFKDLDLKDDFAGTTAMMKSLDLVIGPSSSPIHQAAFAGTKSWFFSNGHAWWSFGEEIPIWRQNARIFAKNENENWSDFMIEKAPEFEKWYQKKLK